MIIFFKKEEQINFFHNKSLLLKILLDNFWIFIFEEKQIKFLAVFLRSTGSLSMLKNIVCMY